MDEQGWELAIAVVREMATGFVELDATEVGAVDGLVAPFEHFAAEEILEQTANPCSLGHPQAHALSDIGGDLVEPEFFAEHTVIPTLGFFELVEMVLEILLVKPSGSVEALELGS